MSPVSSTVPLSRFLGGGTVGHLRSERPRSGKVSGTVSGTVDLKSLARLVLDRDTRRDNKRDSTGKEVSHSGAIKTSFPGQLNTPPETAKSGHLEATVDYRLLHTCCECGMPITERLETWWGGERCHRACGEAAFERGKLQRAYSNQRSA